MKALASFLLLALAAAPAAAAQPFGRTVKIALLDVKAMGAVQPGTISGLNPILARKLADAEGVKLVTSSDLRAMIGGEQKQDLLSCSLAACLAETGRALGIDYVLAPEVAEVGGVYLVSLSLFSVARSRPVTRLTRAPRFDEQLREAVEGGAAELLERAGKLEADPGRRRKKIAVLETSARLPLPGAGEGLGALIASGMAAADDAEVLASADIHALISADQHALLACDRGAPACITEIGGALGVDQVVTSELSKAGSDYVVSLSVVDIRKGQAVARVAKQVEQAGNLTDAASLAVKEALFELGGRRRLRQRCARGRSCRPAAIRGEVGASRWWAPGWWPPAWARSWS